MSGRVIGIRPRTKMTAEGEARPTQIAIWGDNQTVIYDFKSEDDELEFVRQGLVPDDQVAMILGGSGDNFAYALAHRGEKIGATIFRIPPFIVVRELGKDRDKGNDAKALARLLSEKSGLFYPVVHRDLNVIWLRVCLQARTDAMKARIACEQRLQQHLIGAIFCSPEGFYPEGTILQKFAETKANDHIYQALLDEEKRRERELTKTCEELDIYQLLFAPIVGCGPMIAARIIGGVVDIRRFETKAKFRAFCGLGPKDGIFQRRRHGEISNWNPEIRLAFYLLGEQFNRRPDSEWGRKLRAQKEKYRETHPEVVLINRKKRYTDGHIHKMAIWHTLGKFAEGLYKEWWKLAE